MRSVSAIQHQHVACLQHIESREQHLALTGAEAVDHDIARNLGQDVDEHAHSRRWDVTAIGAAEAGIEFEAPSPVDLAAVDDEQPAIVPARSTSKRGVHFAPRPAQNAPKQLAPQPRCAPGRSPTPRRARPPARHAVRGALVPERIQQVPVASSAGVAHHQQQQHHEQVRGRLATATEVASAAKAGSHASARIGKIRSKILRDSTRWAPIFSVRSTRAHATT